MLTKIVNGIEVGCTIDEELIIRNDWSLLNNNILVISVTPWQLRKALNQLGLRTNVESAVAGSNNQDLIDGWEFATMFHSNSAFVTQIASALAKTDADIKDIFTLASTM